MMKHYFGNIVTLLLLIVVVVDATNPIFSSSTKKQQKNKWKNVIAKKQQYYKALKKRASSSRRTMHSEEYYRSLQGASPIVPVPAVGEGEGLGEGGVVPPVPAVPPSTPVVAAEDDDDFWTSFFGNTTTADSLFDTNNISMPDLNFSSIVDDIFGNMSDIFGNNNMSDNAFGFGSDCDIDPSYIETTDNEFPGANFSCIGLYCGSFEFMGTTLDNLILNCDSQCELCIDDPTAAATTITTTVDDEAGNNNNKLCSYVNVVNDYTTEIGPDGTETKTMHSAICAERYIDGDSWDPIEVCLGYNETSTNCEIEHTIGFFGNASKCNSCTTLMCDDGSGSGSSSPIFGVQADCTNIHSDAMIDTCTGDGYVGDFALMPILVNNENVYTVGECSSSSGLNSLGGGLLDVFFGNGTFCDMLEADASMSSDVTGGGEGGVMAEDFPNAQFDCTNECNGNILEQSCAAGCEVCDDILSICGIWSNYMYMNFSSMFMPSATFKMCLDITTQGGGGGEDEDDHVDVDGELCLTMIDDGVNCTISYNDDDCNSCETNICDDDVFDTGFIADCTNIHPAATINTCKKEGLVGPFQILDHDSFDTNRTSTNCNYTTITPVATTTTTTDDSETTTTTTTNATSTTNDKSVETTTSSTNGEDEDATTTTTTTGDDNEATTTATNGGGDDDKDDAFVLFHQSSSLLWKSIAVASLIGFFMNI